MTFAGLTRESIRDISGNLVPLGVLLFFAGWFVADSPWGWDLLPALVVYGLIGHLAVLLFAVTYGVARRLQDIGAEAKVGGQKKGDAEGGEQEREREHEATTREDDPR